MKISLSGMGAMGQIVEQLANERQLNIISTVDYATQTIEDLAPQSDIIIDFSHPDNLQALLDFAVEHNIKLVLATTGYTELDLDKIKAASRKIAILQSYNMSYSMSIVSKTLDYMMSLIDDSFDIEIIEKHHNKKVDAPSGTAHLLYDIVNKDNNFEPCYNYREQNVKRNKTQVGLHAVRGGTIFGEHDVIFAGEDETITLSHQALSKRIFASGSIKGALLLAHKHSGLYTLSDLF